MPPKSRGSYPTPTGLQSKSTPNLPTLQSLRVSQDEHNEPSAASPSTLHPSHPVSPLTSPSEPASIDDFSLDSAPDQPPLSPASDGSEGASEEEHGTLSNLPKRPIYHHHSRSHTYLAPSAFAPPFYGRPPTPLPPSPSLTSLLKPTFSSANSRPTTPDPSSDEGVPNRNGDITGSQTPNSAAASTLTSSFRQAKPMPRASPRVPTYEYYGFTLYLTSSLAFIVYLLWAFLPSPFLHQLGIYYYPNRWWALAIPAWTVMLIVYIYVALASYNTGYLTLPMDSVECLVDEAANIAIIDEHGNMTSSEKSSWQLDEKQVEKEEKPKRQTANSKKGAKGRKEMHSRQNSWTKAQPTPELDWTSMWNEGTDAVMDVPIGGVCEVLYGQPNQNGNLDDGFA